MSWYRYASFHQPRPAAAGGNVLSGGPTEGADASAGTLRVAVKLSGGPTESADAAAGQIRVAVKLSGGTTEGADVLAGTLTHPGAIVIDPRYTIVARAAVRTIVARAVTRTIVPR